MACTITVQLDRRRNHVKVAGEEDRTITRDQENASVSRSLICILLKRKQVPFTLPTNCLPLLKNTRIIIVNSSL